MKFLRFLGLWLILFGLCIVVRLPHLLSEKLFLDIDEATIGIMAKDVLNGKPIPYYFYFQNYGFSTVETLVTAFFIKIVGAGVWALKLGGIFLYSLGCSFLVRFLIEKKTSTLVLICAITVIVAFPSWLIWGTLMRGGYLTAFICTTAVFYISQTKKNTYGMVSIAALLFYIAYESNVLIFAPVLLLLFNWLWSNKFEFWKWLTFSLLFFIPLILARILFVTINFGNVTLDISLHQIRTSLISFGGFWQEAFTGFHNYSILFTLPLYWSILSLILVLLFLYLIITGIASKDTRTRSLLLLAGSIASIVIAGTALSFTPRYSLGLYTGVLLLVILITASEHGKSFKYLMAIVAGITFLGTSIGSKIGDHWIVSPGNELKDMELLYRSVKSRDIAAVYSIDRTAVWNYLYGDDIPSTNVCGYDRSPEFRIRLNQLKAEKRKIGVFGNHGFQFQTKSDPKEKDTFFITQKYFLIETVNDTLLKRIRKNVCME